MKKFRITLLFETDDDWTEEHIKEMFKEAIDSAYQLDDICIGELNVEERKAKECGWKDDDVRETREEARQL